MNKLIIALDRLTPESAKKTIISILEENKEFQDRIIFKIHDLQSLIWFSGLDELLKDIDCKIMLDPKWHDIPNTLKNYIAQLSTTWLVDKIEYITLHASGWVEMLKAAQEAKEKYMSHVKLLAITAMTSLDENDTAYVFDETSQHSVLKLAWLALSSGISGVVSSAHEAQILRNVYGNDFDIVTPWIRFSDDEKGDQKRVMTPGEAIASWSTSMVMWRPILEAENTSQVVQRFFNEISSYQYVPKNTHEFESLLYTGTWKEILSYIGAFYFRPEGGLYCRLASGLLSNVYINIGTIERNYLVIEKASSELAGKIREKNIEVDVVMWAQMWSVRSSLFLAEKLGVIQSVYTEKTWDDNELMKLKRHDIDLQGKKVVISEDIVTKWSTLRKMKSMVEQSGGEVVAIGCIWNRHGSDEFDGVPLFACYVPEAFELYWDDVTPEEQRRKYQRLPEGAKISQKPKNQWDELVNSMRG